MEVFDTRYQGVLKAVASFSSLRAKIGFSDLQKKKKREGGEAQNMQHDRVAEGD